MVENADPSNPYAFRSCGQPKILNGATRAIDIRIAHSGTPQYMPAASLAATGHTDIDRRFVNPFELQIPIERGAVAFIVHGRLNIRFLEELLHSALRPGLTDNHKIPRLHEPNRPGVMCGSQNPCKNSIRDRRLQ